MKTTKFTKAKILVVIALLGMGLLDNIFLHKTFAYRKTDSDLKYFNSEQLKQYDGSNKTLPVYIGFDGYVYDVSAGRDDFYDPERPYHFLAGRDATAELHIAGGAIIKRKYPIIGKLH